MLAKVSTASHIAIASRAASHRLCARSGWVAQRQSVESHVVAGRSHLDFGGNRFSAELVLDTSKVARHRDARYGSPIRGQSHGRAWKPVENLAHVAPHHDCRRFFCARFSVLWRLCVGRLRLGRVPSFPVFPPCTQLSPNPVERIVTAPYRTWSHSCIPSIRPKVARLRIAAWPLVPCTLTHRLPAVLPATTTIWTELVPLKRPLSIHARTPSLRPDRRIV